MQSLMQRGELGLFLGLSGSLLLLYVWYCHRFP